MIYFMGGKTFLDKFVNEDPKKVLSTQYVIVSQSIRKTSGKFKHQMLVGNNALYPNMDLIMDYDDWSENESYQTAYLEVLREHEAFLATIIKFALEDAEGDIVFLCGEQERKYYYLELIRDYVEDRFKYHIVDYKKYKKGKDKLKKKFSPDDTLAICKKVIKKAKKTAKDAKMSTDTGRESIISEMSKKTMKKKLKKMSLYSEGMTKSEMADMLKVFM
jgi:hypothetical protein